MVVNFGPQADGDFRPEEKELAETVGSWMKKYGESIYGCGYSGLPKQDWGYYTRKGDEIYMIVFNVPYSGKLVVRTTKGLQLLNAIMMDGGRELEVAETTNNEYNVSLPSQKPGEPFVVKLKVTEKADKGNKYKDALT